MSMTELHNSHVRLSKLLSIENVALKTFSRWPSHGRPPLSLTSIFPSLTSTTLSPATPVRWLRSFPPYASDCSERCLLAACQGKGAQEG
jgi:hypothetical protein